MNKATVSQLYRKKIWPTTCLTDLTGEVGRDSLLSKEICPLPSPASFPASFPWLVTLKTSELTEADQLKPNPSAMSTAPSPLTSSISTLLCKDRVLTVGQLCYVYKETEARGVRTQVSLGYYYPAYRVKLNEHTVQPTNSTTSICIYF